MTTSCVVGASAGLGRSVAERLAASGHDLFLVASDARDVGALAQDLHLRRGVKAAAAAFDLRTSDPFAVRAAAETAFGPVDNLLLLAGAYSAEDRAGAAIEIAAPLLTVNFTAPILLANAFLPGLVERPASNIVFAGSISTIRPRSRAANYAAAKRGVSHYARAMQHALLKSPCRIQFYRLGYLATQMTFGQRLPIRSAAPEAWARRIVGNLGRDVYLRHPSFDWMLVDFFLNALPWPIFRRLDI